MDGITQLAKMFKERDNKIYSGPQVGRVVSPPPEIKVSLGGSIILTKEDLVISAHLLNEYERTICIPSTSATGGTSQESVGDHGTHSHDVTSIGIANGKIKFIDTLKAGDEVILIPSSDEQIYYLMDKVVKL